MEAEIKIVNGAYRIDTQGEIELVTQRDTAIQAEAGRVDVAAGEGVSLTCGDALITIEKKLPASADVKIVTGPLGKIQLATGPMVGGPRIEMDESSISLSVGPPLLGASLVLDLKGIALKFGGVSFKLSPLGIVEKMVAHSRELNALGHEMKAAETSCKVGVEGITTNAPIKKDKSLGVAQVESTLLNMNCTGISSSSAVLEKHGG